MSVKRSGVFWANRNRVGAVIVLLIFGLLGAARADVMADDDLWDVSQGIAVVDNSYTHSGSRPENMFGGVGGTAETTNTLFIDTRSAGFVHWVQWRTLDPVIIEAFNLVAAHDGGGGRDARERGFSRFTLTALVGQDWVTLYDYVPSNPYGGGVNYTDVYFLELNDNVDVHVTASDFRAAFVQYGDRTAGAKGPRILELDGYGVVVPEPSTIGVMTLGLAVLFRRLR